MPVSVFYGTFAKINTNADQGITGVGFTPRAIILWAGLNTADGFRNGQLDFEVGFASGVGENRAVCGMARDNVATSFAQRNRTEAFCFFRQDNNGNDVARAELASFDSDGFTLTWSANVGPASIIHFLALAGDVVSAEVGSFNLTTGTGDVAVTGVGFRPDFVLMLWTFTEAVDTDTTHLGMGIGMAVSSTQRGALATVNEDGANPPDTWRQQRSSQCILVLAPSTGAQDAIADFVSMDSDGFTVNKSDGPAATVSIFYLALRGARWAVGTFNQPGSTGNQATTGVGFPPRALLLLSFQAAADDTILAEHKIMMGCGTGATARGCTSIHSVDGVTSQNAENLQRDLIAQMITADTTIDAEGDLTSLDTDGWTIDWTTVDAVARQLLYLAIGDDAPRGGGGDGFFIA